jgi:hypothetical protein
MILRKKIIQTISTLTIFTIGLLLSASIVLAFSIFGDNLTRSDSQGAVDISVTYVTPEQEKNDGSEFRLTLNTHSVDLGKYDFEKVIFIQFDNQKATNSGVWKFSGSSHHFKGSITFRQPVPEGTKIIRLLIKGVDEVDERVFEWELPLIKGA